jgi:Ser/Thr protein kinase RdoA (MazF antagonist)
LRLPAIVPSKTGADYHEDAEGGFWRALSFIQQTCCFEKLVNTTQAEEVGRTLGRFHAQVANLDPQRLHDTLPGFHITPHYLERLAQVMARCAPRDTPTLRFCVDFIAAREGQAGVLEEAKQRGLLALRPIHGDPKLNNILFHRQTQRAVSLVDLDTVKPGLIHYDIGDCLRSCCNRTGEDPNAADTVVFDLDIAQAILKPYFQETEGFLTGHDYAYLYDAIRLIPLELGVRFLTDYLEGNRYFKASSPEQNLQRALLQFRLTVSIERNEQAIRQLLAEH